MGEYPPKTRTHRGRRWKKREKAGSSILGRKSVRGTGKWELGKRNSGVENRKEGGTTGATEPEKWLNYKLSTPAGPPKVLAYFREGPRPTKFGHRMRSRTTAAGAGVVVAAAGSWEVKHSNAAAQDMKNYARRGTPQKPKRLPKLKVSWKVPHPPPVQK